MSAGDVSSLAGFGPTTARWLADIGVLSYEDIDRLGSVAVYLQLRASRPGVSLNALWALESLLLGCNWRDLPASRKEQLRLEVAAAEGARAESGRSDP